MRRIISVLAVVALMAALVMVTALPAFADNKETMFTYNSHGTFVETPSGNQNQTNGSTYHLNPAGP